jgi:hypothetical protein
MLPISCHPSRSIISMLFTSTCRDNASVIRICLSVLTPPFWPRKVQHAQRSAETALLCGRQKSVNPKWQASVSGSLIISQMNVLVLEEAAAWSAKVQLWTCQCAHTFRLWKQRREVTWGTQCGGGEETGCSKGFAGPLWRTYHNVWHRVALRGMSVNPQGPIICSFVASNNHPQAHAPKTHQDVHK